MKCLCSLCCFIFGTILSGYTEECGDFFSEVVINVIADEYPEETSWQISDSDSVIYSGRIGADTFCLENDKCLLFTILDKANDGICCNTGLGKYEIYINGNKEIEGGFFKSYASHNILCPQGLVCESASAIDTGAYHGFDNQWYSFIPNTTGRYSVSSCGLGNDCQAALWIYDYCIGLTWDETVVSAIAYSNSGCISEQGGALSATLEKGKKYYLRIGDKNDDCLGEISWFLKFEGPVVGCLDPAACTYNPLASENNLDLCYYAPSDSCPTFQPDLRLDGDTLRESLMLDFVANDDACLRAEGCLSGYGIREVLRFTTKIDNIGNADFIAGPVPNFVDQESEKFEWDQCHQHWHYQGYADYLVFSAEGVQLPIGFKNGFCVLDLYCKTETPKYSCNNMGISAGCTDVYDSAYECQWIDITGLSAGEYALVARVNYDRKPDITGKQEITYENNAVRICFLLERNEEGFPSIKIIEKCDALLDCYGEPNGEAIRDCKGVCSGNALHGDLNDNKLIESSDIDFYLDDIIDDPFIPIDQCYDLNNDFKIDVLDVALLNGCKKQTENGGTLNPNQDRCQFPSNIFNPNDTVRLKLFNLNTELSYIDVAIKNPQTRLQGIQFKLDGINISSLENLSSSAIIFKYNDFGEVVLIASNPDNPISKNSEFSPLLRLYYDNIQGTAFNPCISGKEVVAMNGLFEELSVLPDSNCLFSIVSGFYSNILKSIEFVPNPSRGKINIIDNNALESRQAANLEIINMQGKIMANCYFLFGQQINLENLNLSNGCYLFRVTSKEKSITKKVLLMANEK